MLWWAVSTGFGVASCFFVQFRSPLAKVEPLQGFGTAVRGCLPLHEVIGQLLITSLYLHSHVINHKESIIETYGCLFIYLFHKS